MKQSRNMRGFVSGAMTMLLITSLVTGTLAYTGTKTQTLDYSDIKVVLDGKVLKLSDATGAEVEPFSIDGTTYLPVRAISQALGFEVAWNGDSHTVYISREGGESQNPVQGERVSMATLTPYAIPYPDEDGSARFDSTTPFYNRQTEYHPENRLDLWAGSPVLGWTQNKVPSTMGVTYLTGGEYRQFTAYAASIDGQGSATFQFYDGDTNVLLKKVTVQSGAVPVQVTVDLTGVDKLRITGSTQSGRFGQSVYHYATLNGALYNAYLIK